MVTIKDIARALGVAPSTVTRALSGSNRIGAETVRRVRAQAEAMGYVVDSSARAMRTGRSALVGLLLPDIQNSFYAAMAHVAAEHCRHRGYQLVLSLTGDEPEREEAHIRELVSARCAGILLVPSGGLRPSSAQMLSGVPAVQLVRHCPRLSAPGFGVDDRKALSAACGYLLDLGHRNIGLLVGPEALDTARARRDGFLEAFSRRKLQADENLVRLGPPRAQQGAEATRYLLDAKTVPTAIIAAGSALTDGMLEAIAGRFGPHPPRLSLIGFGDSAAYRWWHGEGLTSIALPVPEIAAAACKCLFDAIDLPMGERPEVSFMALETALVLRGSVSPLGQAG